MIEVERATDLEKYVTECFATDHDFLTKWHIEAPASLGACVSRTLDDMEKRDRLSFKFYVVFVDNKCAAYWGTEHGRYINLFFIKPEHRKRKFVIRLWKEIKKTVEDPFYTAVYAKNRPAVAFYRKIGCQISPSDSHIAFFKFNKETKPCR